MYYQEKINFVENAHHIPLIFKLFPIIIVVLISGLVLLYFIKLKKLYNLNNRFILKLYSILLEKWYFDKIYNFLFVKKLISFSNFLWEKIDQNIIDRLGPIGVSFSVYSASKYLKEFQNGKIFSYATFMILGIILFFSFIFISF